MERHSSHLHRIRFIATSPLPEGAGGGRGVRMGDDAALRRGYPPGKGEDIAPRTRPRQEPQVFRAFYHPRQCLKDNF